MARARKVQFVVSFALPPGATISEAKDYVFDSVTAWRGSLLPPGSDGELPEGDPMFDLNADSVKVKRLIQK